MAAIESFVNDYDEYTNDGLFQRIANDISSKGYSVNPAALHPGLLLEHLAQMNAGKFTQAGIGRDTQHMQNIFVRQDEICWITGESEPGRRWLSWAAELQQFLNRRLFLGLFSFESHFAHYSPGDYYRRHLDAFKGEANRVLSLVVYLNPDWTLDDGGELLLYRDMHDMEGLRITPAAGTVVVFLSEDFPHEVLTAHRDRYSIAGWFRVNTSTAERVDPPL
ncbi:MAG: 2OG-Fe(II) oxygenase [Gammaproteobacteria bacterium]|nr:2OG-Fe(II) oxygenase [Gammaproteobacteria bacterium]